MPPLRFVVYTCWFGYSEHFNDFVYERSPDVDFICFTDDPALKSEFWTVKHIAPGMLDAARAAKRIKALAHLFVPEYAWSLYVDNTVRLKVAPRRIFGDFLAASPSPLVCFRHSDRDCVYDEADAVIAASFDDPSRVLEQMRSYRLLGYPAHNGLATTSFLLRRHHDPALLRVMELWHQQVLRHSKRDQLSLNPVMWFEGFTPTYMTQRFADFELFEWPVVRGETRVPRDFEDARYLEINPDVAEVGMNPRYHYLHYGAAEGRAYK